MKLLAGLGNPGGKYAKTRHNIGFMAIESIAAHYGFPGFRQKFGGLLSDGTIAGERVLLLMPQTFMNESGRSVAEAARFLKIDPGDVIVIHDELDLAPGKVKLKRGGGAAGHNGLRSVDAHLGKEYWRLRLGIGHPGARELVHGWVLSDFAKADQEWLSPLLSALSEHLPLLTTPAPLSDGDTGAFMSKVAQTQRPPRPSGTKKRSAPDSNIPTQRPSPKSSGGAGEQASASQSALGVALATALSRKKPSEPSSSNG